MYNFENSKECLGSTLIPTISLLGDSIIGVEVGVYQGSTFFTFLDNCQNIEKIYGVDTWKPINGLENTCCPMGAVDVDFAKTIFYHRTKFVKNKEKINVVEKTSGQASKDFEDNSVDFVFLDAHYSGNDVKRDLNFWYPKIKVGGLVSGHDWYDENIQKAVLEFKSQKSITKTMSTYDNCWAWIK